MAILLFCIFILLPLAELFVIVQLGGLIGIWPTLALLLIDSIIGAALVRSQGRGTWQRFNEQMAAGRVPGREIVDGAMIIFGGALLLTPGFITDLLGVLLLLPPTRAIWRGLMKRLASRHPAGRPAFFFYDRVGDRSFRRSGSTPPPGKGAGAGASGPGFGGPRPGSPNAGRSYDVDGTAHEISDSERELPGAGENRSEQGGSGA